MRVGKAEKSYRLSLTVFYKQLTNGFTLIFVCQGNRILSIVAGEVTDSSAAIASSTVSSTAESQRVKRYRRDK